MPVPTGFLAGRVCLVLSPLVFFVPVCGGLASCCPFASIFCVFSAFTVQRDGLLKRTFVIVSWIGVVVTRCDQFGWYSDGSCRGSCDWAVAGEAVTGLFLLLVKVVCLCILKSPGLKVQVAG